MPKLLHYLNPRFIVNVALALSCLQCPLVQAELAKSELNDIERISINGRRQNIDQQRVNAATSLNESDIALQQAVHINELLSKVAGSWVSRGNGQESLSAIRSPVLTGAGACGAFLVAEDGINIRPAGFCNTNQLFEVNSEQAASIDVVRGPGSSVYGSNAVHGVINVLTPNVLQPSPLSFGYEAGASGFQRGRFSLSQKDNLLGKSGQQGWMLYGNVMQTDGYQLNTASEQQKLNFIHQYQHQNLEVKTLVAATHLNQNSAGFIQGDDAYLNDELRRSNANPDGFRHANAFRAYSRWLWHMDQNQQLQITPFIRSSDMDFSQHWVPWSPTEYNRQHSAGVQLQYQFQGEHLDIQAGIDSEWSDSRLIEDQQQDFSPTLPQGEHYRYEVNSSAFSPWVNSTWYLSPLTHMTAGLRFDHMRYDYDNQLSDGSACAIDVENCRFYRPQDSQVSFSDWSPSIGFNHRWQPQHSLYGLISRGFRAPQTTELFRLQAGQRIADLDSEQMTNVEFGLRGQWLPIDYDINLFNMRKRNVIFQDTERQNISNGETQHRGVEATFNIELSSQFYSQFSGTYAKHHYSNNIQISQSNINGNLIDTAPKTMGQLTFGWHSGNTTNKPHRVELQWQHLAEYFLNPENTAHYPGHNLLHLSSSFWLSEHFKLSVNVRNLTDKKYAERADYAFGNYRYFVGFPRSVYLGLMFNW